MANVKISALPAAAAATGTDVVPLVQGSTTKKLSMSALLASPTLFGSGVAAWFANPTSANLAAAVTDETGSGALVFAVSPSFTTPSLGAATALTINRVTFTQPAAGATLTIADGKTLTANRTLTLTGTDGKTLTINHSLTLSGTDGTVMTFPTTSASVARTDAGQNFTGTQTFAGPVVIGDTAAPSVQRVQIVGDATAGAANVLLRRFSNDASGPNYVLSKSRGTSATATTIVQNGDSLGAVTWQAADGATFSSVAQIAVVVDGAPGAGDLPTAIVFSTTADGAAVANERFRINNVGSITSSNQADAVGYKGIPVNEQSAAYTLVIGDQGKTIVHPITDNNPRTFTIPNNGSIPFPVGTAITFINMINTVTIAITTDTMYLAGAGTTGSRTLAAYGMATAVKVTSTSWIISGNGLT